MCFNIPFPYSCLLGGCGLCLVRQLTHSIATRHTNWHTVQQYVVVSPALASFYVEHQLWLNPLFSVSTMRRHVFVHVSIRNQNNPVMAYYLFGWFVTCLLTYSVIFLQVCNNEFECFCYSCWRGADCSVWEECNTQGKWPANRVWQAALLLPLVLCLSSLHCKVLHVFFFDKVLRLFLYYNRARVGLLHLSCSSSRKLLLFVHCSSCYCFRARPVIVSVVFFYCSLKW